MSGPGRPRPGTLATPVAPGDSHKVAIVVVNWNGRPFLERALRSIVEHTHERHELIVVDNGSEDGSVAWLGTFSAPGAERLEIVRNPTNRFFSAAFNQGFNAASPDARYVMVFCNDVEAKQEGWLLDFVEAIRAAPGAIASGHAARQALPDEHRALLLERFPDYGDASIAERVRAAALDPATRYAHLAGYCFLLDRARLRETGLYLEGGPFRQYHSDWELYLRFHALGHRVASFTPRVHHWHSISELIAEHPARYAELLERIEDPDTLERYLRHGRPLFREESGWRALEAAARSTERDG